MKLSYKYKIFSFFVVIFSLFACSIVYFEQIQEKKYRAESLETQLGSFANVIHNYILDTGLSDSSMWEVESIVHLLPSDLRITIVDMEGQVRYDNEMKTLFLRMDNHKNRPEVMKAMFQGKGTNIRMSSTRHQEYLYYAVAYPNYVVRVALPYNISTKALLRSDNLFIYIVIALFTFVLILLNAVSERFGKSLRQLRNLAISIREGKNVRVNQSYFPNDELGEIGKDLMEIFRQKEQGRQQVEMEREKLIKHLQFRGEGVAIFSSSREHLYANSHFIHYLNLLKESPSFAPESIFEDPQFSPITHYLAQGSSSKQTPLLLTLSRNGKIFQLQTLCYDDDSFEISIQDITKLERTRRLKQEMTNNIAHELRTPVAGIRAYLETINDKDLPPEKVRDFIHRAYVQSVRLSELIEDVSLLSKIEEQGACFAMEEIRLSELLSDVRIDFVDRLDANQVRWCDHIDNRLKIWANYSLVYSVFCNLVDNTIKYGGNDIQIHVGKHHEDADFVYIYYRDTGRGVEKEHLTKIFERFYRVDKGRTRQAGGTGLGLSIVKNAVLLHGGDIQASTGLGGGLEFLFSLPKRKN